MTSYWTPEIGQQVWMNYPDFEEPLGKVVGYVPEGERRAGQPVIECQEDEPDQVEMFFRSPSRKKGDRFVVAQLFLLPFPYRGEEWKRAEAEGRIG